MKLIAGFPGYAGSKSLPLPFTVDLIDFCQISSVTDTGQATTSFQYDYTGSVNFEISPFTPSNPTECPASYTCSIIQGPTTLEGPPNDLCNYSGGSTSTTFDGQYYTFASTEYETYGS